MGLDESMSNLTSTISGETSISSNARNDQSSSTTTATATANANTNTMLNPQPSSSSLAPPAKKKRGLPGNPDPDAEVIALSPKSLLATNRFICEICNKGFQRDQNLQLHRRGHNLPWKLKQRVKDQIIRKKVYVCPEPSCVHHDPSRALGDLTGIKKHFCRKHGEKKWKCEKCSKKYAVQSDWKAHSKICGTREYRCDCGTLFSRRDSFITHRAFCDALAEESARAINPLSTLPSSVSAHQPAAGGIAGMSTNSSTALSHFALPPHLTSHQQLLQSFPMKREPDHHHHQHQLGQHSNMITVRSDIPPWLTCPPPSQQTAVDGGAGQLDHHQQSSHLYSFQHHQQQQYEQQSSSNNGLGSTLSSFQAPVNPQMSATALLQKAAEMGVTVSNQQQQQQQQGHQGVLTNSNSCGLTVNPGFMEQGQVEGEGGGGGQSSMLHDVMLLSSFQSSASSVSGGFDSSSFGDFHHQAMTATKSQLNNSGGGNEGLTRDFLGLRTFSHKDFLNMAGLGHMSPSSASFEQQLERHQNNQTPW